MKIKFSIIFCFAISSILFLVFLIKEIGQLASVNFALCIIFYMIYNLYDSYVDDLEYNRGEEIKRKRHIDENSIMEDKIIDISINTSKRKYDLVKVNSFYLFKHDQSDIMIGGTFNSIYDCLSKLKSIKTSIISLSINGIIISNEDFFGIE